MSGIFDQIINYAPPSLLLGTVTYKGTWSAATNTPTLVDPTSAITNGNYYVVDAAGTQFTLVFNIGDWIISNGSTWEKVDNTDAISSVFGRTGAVVGVSTDYSSVGITNTALGASNPSTVAATTVTATSTIAATGAVTGSNLSGTNTGDQTITLTGGVTGSGTGSFAATVVTNANLTGVITSVGNATSIASQTGTGSKFVVDTSPTLITPDLGTPSALVGTNISGTAAGLTAGNVTTNANLTGDVTSIGNAATVVTNANLTGDVTSVGNATTLTNAPVIAKVLTGYSSGAGTVAATDSILQAIQKLDGNDATNANLTGVITSVGNATSIASQTGTGTKFVVDTSPTLVTPNIGVATGTSLAAALNGSLGATTPSTVAATTISATGVASLPGFKASKTTATSGFISSADEGDNVYNVLSSRNNANNAYLPLTIRSGGSGVALDNGLAVTGALSKGSGSFRIEHPLPSKSATHELVHSFIEGPKCDLIYRGKIDLVDGKATVNIDTDSTMTEGTFEALCATVQCFTSNESGWGAIRGKVVGNILTIEAQDAASTDSVSWMVIGERKDKHIIDTDWTDENGRPIVEPLKPVVESK
jgi:hypothetical protein